MEQLMEREILMVHFTDLLTKTLHCFPEYFNVLQWISSRKIFDATPVSFLQRHIVNKKKLNSGVNLERYIMFYQ